MGKAATPPAPAEMKRKKKKGRPSLSDLQKRNQKTLTPSPNPTSNSNSTLSRRSTRRNPNPSFIDDDEDDDDERKEKKVKLVVRLPQSNQQQHLQNCSPATSGSDSDPEGDNHEASPKKRKINAIDHRSADQGEKVSKVTDTRQESPLESGPTTPLPDKKLLVFILDRLQKKDTYGVFSEPVDPNELPDYHEIIERPMDFGTVRKKLNGGVYTNLEELEADVYLICSNAMEYNAPDTVYFRQARSIQELAKRDFANLRHEGEDGELQPKVVRRGRPPTKNLKKSFESVDHVDPEHSSGATLASAEDKAVGSNSYNLRKGATFYRFRSTDMLLTSYRARNDDDNSECLADWNKEFPAHILRADMKYGKKNFTVDENRRDTYKQLHSVAFGSEKSVPFNSDSDTKRLMAVGLNMEPHAYARSLTRFAANLGPVAWKVAMKKLEPILPAGRKLGPGWVGENDAHSQQSSCPTEKLSSSSLASEHNKSRPVTPNTTVLNSPATCSSSEEMVEAARRLNAQNELTVLGGNFSWTTPASSSPAQQKSIPHPNKNGFNGMFEYNLSSQLGIARLAISAGQPGPEEASVTHQMHGLGSRNEASSINAIAANSVGPEERKLLESWSTLISGNSLCQGKGPGLHGDAEVVPSGKPWHVFSPQHRQSLSVPPDLNVRAQPPGSPGSNIPIGSPQQPDLALQL